MSATLPQINTISQIRHSAAAGHTILMCQTDEIHESFYDLFNQHFRCIEDPDHGTRRYYANIAIGAHSKPCRVDPNFQCVVVVKESDIDKTPAPFLNRFEKYRLTHKELLRTIQQSLPPCLHILLNMVSVMVSVVCCGVHKMLILNLMPLILCSLHLGHRLKTLPQMLHREKATSMVLPKRQLTPCCSHYYRLLVININGYL